MYGKRFYVTAARFSWLRKQWGKYEVELIVTLLKLTRPGGKASFIPMTSISGCFIRKQWSILAIAAVETLILRSDAPNHLKLCFLDSRWQQCNNKCRFNIFKEEEEEEERCATDQQFLCFLSKRLDIANQISHRAGRKYAQTIYFDLNNLCHVGSLFGFLHCFICF